MINSSGLKGALIRIAAIIIALYTFILSFFYIAIILLLIVIPIKLFKALRQREDKPAFKQHLLSAGVYAIAAVLIIMAFNLNNNLAKERLATIAAACEQYKLKYGEYPAKLPILVPEFINKIPAPKIEFFITDKFRYLVSKDRHSIMYVELPPFSRRYYTLETKQWGHLD